MSAQNQPKGFPLFRYFSEVSQEAQRVSWPTRKQTLEKTGVVIAVSLIVGAYLGALDFVFASALGFLFR